MICTCKCKCNMWHDTLLLQLHCLAAHSLEVEAALHIHPSLLPLSPSAPSHHVTEPDSATAQGYASEMARCIKATGQDTDTNAGDRLRQILEEYCCLHVIRARTAPSRWRSLLTWTIIQGPCDQIAATPMPPDWLALAVSHAAAPPGSKNESA